MNPWCKERPMMVTSVQCSIGDQVLRNVTDLQRPDVCSINNGRNKCGSNYQRVMLLECEERNNGWGRWSECNKVCIYSFKLTRLKK